MTVMKKTLQWPRLLKNAEAIADYIVQLSTDDPCHEMIEEFFFNSHARLELRRISDIIDGNPNGNVKSPTKQKKYARMQRRSRPPIVLDYSGAVADGNHRLRDARAKGETFMLCYVPYED